MSGFLNFIKEKGVVGLAIGFILGGSVSRFVSSFINDILNPIIGLILGKMGSLTSYVMEIGTVKIFWGNFISSLIDFLVIIFVVYFGFKFLRLDKFDNNKK